MLSTVLGGKGAWQLGQAVACPVDQSGRVRDRGGARGYAELCGEERELHAPLEAVCGRVPRHAAEQSNRAAYLKHAYLGGHRRRRRIEERLPVLAHVLHGEDGVERQSMTWMRCPPCRPRAAASRATRASTSIPVSRFARQSVAASRHSSCAYPSASAPFSASVGSGGAGLGGGLALEETGELLGRWEHEAAEAAAGGAQRVDGAAAAADRLGARGLVAREVGDALHHLWQRRAISPLGGVQLLLRLLEKWQHPLRVVPLGEVVKGHRDLGHVLPTARHLQLTQRRLHEVTEPIKVDRGRVSERVA